MRMSPVTPRARSERLSYSPSTMIGACRFFSVRSSRTRCKSSWSCSQSIGSLTERPGDDKGCAQEAIIYRPPDMHDVPGEEEVNFERVTKVYREESGKKTLVSLEADFYDRLTAYIGRLEESANKEAQKDPNSPKALLLQDEIRKVRKRRDQIFTYRERKLALLASSRASGSEVEVPNLPAPERFLFDNMVALLRKSRTHAFGGSAFGVEPAPPPSTSTVVPAKERPAGMKAGRSEETRR